MPHKLLIHNPNYVVKLINFSYFQVLFRPVSVSTTFSETLTLPLLSQFKCLHKLTE